MHRILKPCPHCNIGEAYPAQLGAYWCGACGYVSKKGELLDMPPRKSIDHVNLASHPIRLQEHLIQDHTISEIKLRNLFEAYSLATVIKTMQWIHDMDHNLIDWRNDDAREATPKHNSTRSRDYEEIEEGN